MVRLGLLHLVWEILTTIPQLLILALYLVSNSPTIAYLYLVLVICYGLVQECYKTENKFLKPIMDFLCPVLFPLHSNDPVWVWRKLFMWLLSKPVRNKQHWRDSVFPVTAVLGAEHIENGYSVTKDAMLVLLPMRDTYKAVSLVEIESASPTTVYKVDIFVIDLPQGDSKCPSWIPYSAASGRIPLET